MAHKRARQAARPDGLPRREDEVVLLSAAMPAAEPSTADIRSDRSSAFAIVVFLRDVACSSHHIGSARRTIYPPTGGHSAVSRGRHERRALGQVVSCAAFPPRRARAWNPIMGVA